MNNEILEFFTAEDYLSAADYAQKELSVDEIVALVSSLDEKHLVPFSRALDSELMAQVLVELDTDIQQKIIDGMHDYELGEVFDEVSLDDTVDIIEELPENLVVRIAETEDIVKLFEERKFSVLKPLLSQTNPTDIAEVFDQIDDDGLAILFRILPKDLAAETFVEMESDKKEKLLKKLSDVEVRSMMNELFIDDAVDLVEEMPANVVKRLLRLADDQTRDCVNEILNYPRDSAGSIMTIEYVSLHADMTVDQAFDRIRKTAIDKETIYTCYVKDSANTLVGIVSAKDLMLAQKDATIESIMETNVIYAYTTDDKEEVANKISEYGFLALPIVDKETRLVGIVTVDDAIDVIKEEQTEDIAKMSAVTPSDKPYLKTSIWRICLNRLPWLLLLMLSGTLTGLVISANEQTLNMDYYGILLTACMPMIMGTGGNSGAQASSMVIRGIALGEISFSDFWRVVWKEIRVSFILGAVLAVACFAKLMLIDGYWSVNNGILVSIVVSITMVLTIFVAKMIGAMLPLISKACKLDPAVVASPFITTIVDVVSLLIYCAIATTLLGTL